MLTLAVTTASAQRYSCIRPSERAGTRQQYALPEVKTFDPQKTYRQPVILVTCSDASFTMADPADFYNRIFNESGYNEGVGMGCVADYVRDQSGGRLNVKFDIYGPVKVDLKAGGHLLRSCVRRRRPISLSTIGMIMATSIRCFSSLRAILVIRSVAISGLIRIGTLDRICLEVSKRT